MDAGFDIAADDIAEAAIRKRNRVAGGHDRVPIINLAVVGLIADQIVG